MPNPAATTVTVDLRVTTQARLDVVDVTGRVVQSLPVDAGTQMATLDVSALLPGRYTVRLVPAAGAATAGGATAVFIKQE